MNWSKRNVLVTGATGLLGSWLVEELLHGGAEVVCLVRDEVPRSRLFLDGVASRVIRVRGELEDRDTISRALNEYEIDSVFHLGAQTIVGTASRSPISTFEANIRGTWNVLEACRGLPKIQRIVVASSDKAYGSHEQLPYRETAPLEGRFPYDVSKSCSDLIALSYFHTYRLPLAITRCGNLYGGGDLNFNRLFPGTIRSALQGTHPLVRSDGTFVRDYFYVRDAVDAYLRLADRLPDPGIVGEAFNFGTETPMSVLEAVGAILRACGADHLTPKILGEASHEIHAQFLDCAKARDRLGFAPTRPFDTGLRETIDWYRRWLATAR